jgi:hypothetical protein
MKQGIRVDRLSMYHTMIVEIKVSKQFKARLWIGAQLLKMAALAFGCRIELKNSDNRDFA